MASVHTEPVRDTGTPATPSHLSSDAGPDDARICRQVAARHARTFSLAARLLPAAKRRAAFALYATCRTADDIVDGDATHRPEATAALRRFRTDAFRALAARSPHPILRELGRAWHAFHVPDELLHELFDGLEHDLTDQGFATWPQLARYCEGVAGSVGAMCCSVFGVAGDAGTERVAVTRARTLGVAMQLTNILRDVGEDAHRGRCYLPLDELRRHGFDANDVLSGEVRRDWRAWRAFMASQVERARALYRQASPGFRLLSADAQACAVACATGYAAILDAIEEADFDTLSRRVATSRLTLLGVAWRAWRGDGPGIARD